MTATHDSVRAPRAIGAVLFVTLLALLLPVSTAQAAPLTTPQASQATPQGWARQVAVVGVPGLLWSDVDASRTPRIAALMKEGASASMSTRAIPPPDRSITCPVAGWATVSAGQRAGAPGTACEPPQNPAPAAEGAVKVPGWDALTKFNRESTYRAPLGGLGESVVASGKTVAAVGPGAAIGAATVAGEVKHYAQSTADLSGLGDLSRHGLIVMEADEIARAWFALSGSNSQPPTLPAPDREKAVAAADRSIGLLLDRLPRDTLVLLAGPADTSPTAHLHVAIARGPSPSGTPYSGVLSASSTRQNGLVTITDLTATALQALGLRPGPQMVGRMWQNSGPAPADTARDLADADLASQILREVRGPFFAVFVAVQVLFYGIAALAFRRWRKPRILAATQKFAVFSGAIAVSTFLAQLVPWHRVGAPAFTVVASIVGIAVALAAAAFAGPWRRHVLGPLTVVAGATSVALLIDVMTGSHLQVNAVTGYEPVTGGRFYGFSNIAFAVFSTGTILFLAGVAQFLIERGRRLLALVAALAYGLLAIFADGWPGWGADFGGVPAFVLGFAVFMLLLSGRRVSVGKLVLIGLGGAALIASIAFIDYLRPAEKRTHLGVFAEQVVNGEAFGVVSRKLSAMIGTLGNWQLTLLSVAALAFLFLVLNRPDNFGVSTLSRAYTRAPALRAGLFGALTCALAGFLTNDSGIAIPAMALTVAVPLTLAACVRVLQLATPTTPSQPSEPAEEPEPPAS
ncbi:hypothetical protein [Sinosporangium siamense]|uniref:Uncharacterized protein n=1 Tax=Sinosporangium siamense TaxID=1367973 RepID=A0A919RMB0_9ACTN|nr:hypothetical protein [Sinosporangium siamense]GII95817.1 hypothetical protein Ssi02_60480 [Sinosporangium siamense]